LRRGEYPFCNGSIRLHDVSPVEAVDILIKRRPGLLIPEPHRVHADLVADDDLPVMAAELELEVDQGDAALIKILSKYPVYRERRGLDLVELLRRGKPRA